MFEKKQIQSENPKHSTRSSIVLILCCALFTGFIYYSSNSKPQTHFDYTLRVAENFSTGKIGLTEKPPSWLNEMIPFEGLWFSAFPLGSVLTLLPAALLKSAGIINENPAGFLAVFAAAATAIFLLLIATHYKYSWIKRILLVSAILFGTWMWTNLMMAGAWHLALGFAVLGEAGAIYFSIFNRRPLLAGFFFALAFGNRTEILLTAPIFMYLSVQSPKSKAQSPNEIQNPQSTIQNFASFCVVPFILGVSTLIYNYLRFHSFTDFGYARIPGVLNEPWYAHGIFSLSYIPLNAREMLLTQWKSLPAFPYLAPTGFGGAIWWSSPFLFFLFRPRARNKILWRAAWVAIFVLTFLLWTHGNPGGWQFSYRYAMTLLPWIFLILLENSPEETTPVEWFVYLASVAINAYATYLFFWTDYIKP
ncbi:MAG TPA: hypothetical protein VEQ34_05095 [Pyrinomonadaceae bacterium]|nr:hypothetical protein [Pyrinomonadaceae bacterium]